MFPAHPPAWLWFLLIGGLAGWVGGALLRGGRSRFVGDIAAGIAGGLLGGFLFAAAGLTASGLAGALVMSTVGAVLLMAVRRLATDG